MFYIAVLTAFYLHIAWVPDGDGASTVVLVILYVLSILMILFEVLQIYASHELGERYFTDPLNIVDLLTGFLLLTYCNLRLFALSEEGSLREGIILLSSSGGILLRSLSLLKSFDATSHLLCIITSTMVDPQFIAFTMILLMFVGSFSTLQFLDAARIQTLSTSEDAPEAEDAADTA